MYYQTQTRNCRQCDQVGHAALLLQNGGGLPRPKGTCGKDRNVAIESAVLMGMLSFRDMTIGRSTDDGRTDVGNQRISAVP